MTSTNATGDRSGGVGAGTRRAVLVGINAYVEQPLFGCVRDIAAVERFLVRERGFQRQHLRVLTNHDATRSAIVRALRELVRESQPGDLALFYFCGHGVSLPVAGGLFDEALCPVDFSWSASSALRAEELGELFGSFAAGVSATCILDASFAAELEEEPDLRVFAARRMCPPLEDWPRAARRRLTMPESCTFVTACGSEERAADLFVDEAPHGAFTYHLLDAARAAPDATYGELVARARRALGELGQAPKIVGPGLEQRFLHPAPLLAPTATPVAPPTDHGPVATRWMLHSLSAPAPERRRTRETKPPVTATCRAFWWGFHLELPHEALQWLATAGTRQTLVKTLELLIGDVPRRAAPHLGALVEYMAAHLDEVCEHDQGAGVHVTMSAFEPDVFVTTGLPRRTGVARPRRIEVSTLPT